MKDFTSFFYSIEKFVSGIFRKYSFFGIGKLIRKNGSLVIIFLITVFVSFSNLYASSDTTTFLVGYWQNEQNKISDQNTGNFLVDENSSNIQIVSDSSESGLLGEFIQAKRAVGSSDPGSGDDVTIYTVKEGDTIGQIAQNYKVSINTILWANEIESVTSLKPGTTLFILPTSGVKHVVKKSETLQEIAKKYEVDEKQIIAFNDLPANGEIKENEELIVPGGKKEEATTLLTRRTYNNEPEQPTPTTGGGGIKGVGSSVAYSKTRQPWNHFPAGYCTYYVSQRVRTTWRGNAGAWLYNAKVQGYKTGKEPRVGSIMVTTEDARYGHVAFVESVSDTTFVVSEMNYKGFNVVNKRTVSKRAPYIKGFVYP